MRLNRRIQCSAREVIEIRSASWGKLAQGCQPKSSDTETAASKWVISQFARLRTLYLVCNFLALFTRCNAKQSCTFDGRANCCGICLCGSDAGFNHYFGNPCSGDLGKCLEIEYVCIAQARKKRGANVDGLELGICPNIN